MQQILWIVAERPSIQRLASAVLLSLFLAAPQTAAAQDTLRAAAIVNDEVVSMLDLAMRTRLAILSAGLEDTPEVRQRLRPQVLRALVDERLQMQEAERLGIEASESQIDEAINNIARQNNATREDFLRFLENNGVLPTALRGQIRAGLTWQLVLDARMRPTIEVSDEEVDAVIERIQSERGKQEVRLSEIFLAIDNALQEEEVLATASRLYEQLRSGANFEALARQFSQSSTASVGGDLGWISEGQLDNELVSALEKIRPGQITPPVQTLGGVYLLWLRDQRKRTPGEVTVTLKQVLIPLPDDASQELLQQSANRAGAMRQRIDSCGTAEQVAAEANDVLTGDRGPLRLAALPPQMSNLISTLPVGQPSRPLRVREGMALFLVCDRDEGTIDRERILQSIVNERLGLLARRYMRDLRRAANVDLRS